MFWKFYNIWNSWIFESLELAKILKAQKVDSIAKRPQNKKNKNISTHPSHEHAATLYLASLEWNFVKFHAICAFGFLIFKSSLTLLEIYEIMEMSKRF